MGGTWCGSGAKGRGAGPLWLALLLLLCALPVMVGCGGNGKPQPTVRETAPPAVEKPAADEEPAEEEEPKEEEPAEEEPKEEESEQPDEVEEPVEPEEDPLFTQEGLEELVQQTLEKIIAPEMTQLEQARAVWDYAKGNIRYTGTSDKSDWQAGAYEGLSRRKGDCFTYYAVSRALLTALDIENLEVQRVGGKTSHYWNLVNCGEGWYHFDATPRNVRMPRFTSFMFTDADAETYNAMAGWGYYAFDGSLYPERGEGPPADIRPPLPQPDPEDEELEGLDPEDADIEETDPEGAGGIDPEGTDIESTDPESTDPEGTAPDSQDPETTDPGTSNPEVLEDPVYEPSDGPELGTQEEPEMFPPEPALPGEDAAPFDGGEFSPELEEEV